MGCKTIPGGLLEYARLTCPLQYVDLNAGSPNAACSADQVRIIEYIEMNIVGLTQEAAAAILRLYGTSTYAHSATVCNAMVNVNLAPATVSTGWSVDDVPKLWEPGVTAALTVSGTSGESIRICYRIVPLSIAIEKFLYQRSIDAV